MRSALQNLLHDGPELRPDHDLFSATGLQALQEAAYDATGLYLDDLVLIRLFGEFPSELQWLARRYGLHDQHVADQVLEWVAAHLETVAAVTEPASPAPRPS